MQEDFNNDGMSVLLDTDIGTTEEMISTNNNQVVAEPTYCDAAYAYLAYKGIPSPESFIAMLKTLTSEQKRACADTIITLHNVAVVDVNMEIAPNMKAYSLDVAKDIIRRRHAGAEFISSFVQRIIGDAAVIGITYNKDKDQFELGLGCYGKYNLAEFVPSPVRARYCHARRIACANFSGGLKELTFARNLSLQVRVTVAGSVTPHPTPPKLELPHGIVHYSDNALVKKVQDLFSANAGKYEANEAGIMSILARVEHKDSFKKKIEAVCGEMMAAHEKLRLEMRSNGLIVDKVLRVITTRQAYYANVYGIVNTAYALPVLLFVPNSQRLSVYADHWKINIPVDMTDSTRVNIINNSLSNDVFKSMLGGADDAKKYVRFLLAEARVNSIFSRVATYVRILGYTWCKLLAIEDGLAPFFIVVFQKIEEEKSTVKNTPAVERIITGNVALILYKNHAIHARQINNCAYEMMYKINSTYRHPMFDISLCNQLMDEGKEISNTEF